MQVVLRIDQYRHRQRDIGVCGATLMAWCSTYLKRGAGEEQPILARVQANDLGEDRVLVLDSMCLVDHQVPPLARMGSLAVSEWRMLVH